MDERIKISITKNKYGLNILINDNTICGAGGNTIVIEEWIIRKDVILEAINSKTL